MNVNLQYKVVLLGQAGVGKSSVVLRFVTDSYNNDLDPTIGASYLSKIISLDGNRLKLSIWDTAGQERYQSLARMYYSDSSAAILVYDITSRESYEYMKKWHSELKEFGPRNVVMAIVGNKEDLVEHEKVDMDEARNFAHSVGAIYQRTSAKSSAGVNELFEALARKLLRSSSLTSSSAGNIRLSTASTERKRRKCC